jgi:hypothetical protein
MRRCVSAKVVLYHNDGSGRDTFIEKFNGGFQSPSLLLDNTPKPLDNPFNPEWKVGHVSTKPSMGRPIHLVNYRTDGSGRDSYIQDDNGGLYPHSNGHVNLIQYLRRTEAKGHIKIKPRGKLADQLRRRAVLQRAQSARLSAPKKAWALPFCCSPGYLE